MTGRHGRVPGSAAPSRRAALERCARVATGLATAGATGLRGTWPAAFGLAGLAGCDAAGRRSAIDVEWHRQDLRMHLTRWLAQAPTPSGLMKAQFDRRGQPKDKAFADLTMHSRLVYALIVGHELTGDAAARDEALRGAEFLLARFRDPLHGGFYQRVDAEGKVVHDGKNTYGHAFALLALSHLARITREARFRDAALETWAIVGRHLRDPQGGLRPDAPRDFGPSRGTRTQNPVMHMFEALLALADATGEASARAGAQGLGDFVLYKLLQGRPDGSAFIPEWYDERWLPLTTKAEGAYADLGHQFEWVHLLLTGEQNGLPALYGAAAQRVLDYALALGYDEPHGGVLWRAYPDGSIERDKFWWQQAEGLHALLVAARHWRRPELWRRYEQTLELVREQIVDLERGAWRPGVKRSCDNGHCPDELPEPYHMVSLHAAALRPPPTPA